MTGPPPDPAGAPGDEAPGTPAPPRRRLPLRRAGVILGVWAVLAGGALGLANALDSPVGAGEVDAARPVAPESATATGGADTRTGEGNTAGSGSGTTPDTAEAPGEPGIVVEAPRAPVDPAAEEPDTAQGDAVTLPPFAMVLDRALPDDIAGLAPAAQALELRTVAMATGNPDRLVELGSVLQLLGDVESARFSYQSAFDRDPMNSAARVGLALVDATGDPSALPAVADRLQEMATADPRNQLIAFNQAWVAIYRRDRDGARTMLERVVSLGSETRLGRTAGALLAATESVELEPSP